MIVSNRTLGSQVGRVAKTEGSTSAYAKVRGGKELGRWSRGAGKGAQRSSERGREYEKMKRREWLE